MTNARKLRLIYETESKDDALDAERLARLAYFGYPFQPPTDPVA